MAQEQFNGEQATSLLFARCMCNSCDRRHCKGHVKRMTLRGGRLARRGSIRELRIVIRIKARRTRRYHRGGCIPASERDIES
jgi:hypothetical protein